MTRVTYRNRRRRETESTPPRPSSDTADTADTDTEAAAPGRSRLVLGRREGERLILRTHPHCIEIEPTGIMGSSQVRLTITSDRSVQILRGELLARKGIDPLDPNPPMADAPPTGERSSLTLGRRPGEWLYLYAGPHVIGVTVARIRHGQVRIAIDSVPDVSILRGELEYHRAVGDDADADPVEPGDRVGNR